MKKREELLKRAYQKVLEVGLGNRSIDDLSSFIEQNVMGYGTAIDEKILSMADFIDLVQLQRKQAINFDDFHFTSNPFLIRLTDNDNTGIVVDEIELVTKIGNDSHQLDLRMTAVFEFKEDSWKLLHWHSSKPEHVSDGEDPWHMEEWKKKTEKLERMVDEKTAELIKKNEELEVEASLERVRAVAMGMAKSEDLLNICEVSYKEFRKLGFDNLRNTLIHIPNDEQKYLMDYDYSEFTGGDIAKIEYGSHPIVDEYLEKIRSAADAYFEVVINKDQLSDWKEFRKNSGQSDDARLDEAEALYYYLFSIGIGDIGISTFKPINKSQIKILKRFRNVFDLAYKRYKDIALAEAQAREAQIQLSLERVRARSMAMQKSEDLSNVASVTFEQMKILGGDLFSFGIVLCDKHEDMVEQWHSLGNEGMMSPFLVPIDLDYIHRYRYDQWKKGEELFSIEIPEDYITRHFELMFELPSVDTAMKEVAAKGVEVKIPDWEIDYGASFRHGYLLVSSLKPFKENQIFPRFAKVFEQAYIRFLDLKKAEAQAREAQIEAGLERARAQSMMMQHSEELNKTSQVFHEQLRLLGIDSEFSYLWLPDEVKNEHLFWVTWQEAEGGCVSFKNKQVIYPLDKSEPAIAECYVAWESGMPVHVNPVPATGVESYFNTWSELLEGVDKFKPELYPDGLYYVDAYMKYGCFGIMIRKQLSEDEQQVLHRFSREFERAYTRFLDLKKAEAQAREAQIEAALEKVRGRSLAMQSADELSDVVKVIVEKLQDLDVVLDANGVVLCTYFQDTKDVLHWIASKDFSFVGSYLLPYFDHPIFNDAWSSKESGAEYFSKEFSIEEKNSFFEYAFEHSDYQKFPKEFKEWVFQNDRHILSFAWQKNSAILIPSHTGVVPSKENVAILKRFAKVFEQSYVRFLDLQKAEAQARESQIELSLERIRAQVTAMKESTELLDIVVTMRTEFVSLGHEAHYFWHMRYLPNKYEKAMTSGDGARIGMVMSLPRHIHGDIKLLADWEKSDEPTVVFSMDVETAIEYVDKMISLGDFQQVDPNAPTLDDIRQIGGLTFVMARTTHGEIGFSLPGVVSNVPDEDLSTLIRFAGVFDLAYRRFEDLKSSERRNREAQIELALERVRAKTMAMQKSNELAQTAAHLFSQLNELGIKPYRCNIAIVDEELKNCRLWSTTNSGNVIPTGSALPLNEHPILQETYDGWKTQKPNHIIKLAGTERLEWTRYISKHLPFEEYKEKNINEDELIRETAFLTNLYFKQGFFTIHSKEELVEDQVKIIQRFAYVFEQTYTRFLDLENAEKQNKIIQAENERKTEELEEARQLQLAMLPKEVPQLSNLDIAVFMKTATEVGGDYYDFHVDKKNNLTAIIGDATGHGMKAGTMVTITKSLFNSLASSKDILKIFKRISEVIKNMNFRQLSMCLQMIKINGSELSISSAAMPPAFIYHYVEDSVEEILLSGMPLGAILNYQYKIEKRKLNSGDVIFLLSDGLPELHNHKKHMYGYDRVKTELRKVGKTSPQKIVEHFKESANEWLSGYEQDDDVTFVVIKIK